MTRGGRTHVPGQPARVFTPDPNGSQFCLGAQLDERAATEHAPGCTGVVTRPADGSASQKRSPECFEVYRARLRASQEKGR